VNIIKIAGVTAVALAAFVWASTAAATTTSYGSVLRGSAEAPNTGISPVLVLPYVIILVFGIALVILVRHMFKSN
jgi:hypothetical protein